MAWHKCEWLAQHVGKPFDAMITTVTHFGLFVSLKEVLIDGMVHIRSLGAEYFQFDEERLELIGQSTHKTYRSGQAIKVRLLRVDVVSQHVDCDIIG